MSARDERMDEQERTPSAAKRPWVLLVEDDESHVALVRRALRNDPRLALVVVRRMIDARTAIERSPPALVIADAELPDGDAITLARRVSCPFLVMTTSAMRSVSPIDAGTVDCFVKSRTTAEELRWIVARALRESHHRRARVRADRLLRAQCEIASAFATSLTLADAGPRVLACLAEHAGCTRGELWRVRGDVRQCDASWSADASLDHSTFAAPAAIQAIEVAGTTIGFIELFARAPMDVDDELRLLLDGTARQLAVFLARQAAEDDRLRLHETLVERERLAAIGQTAASLAHEISNPLSGMYLACQLLQLRLAAVPSPDPRLSSSLGRMMVENRRLNALLEEFRALSMRQIIERTATDVRELLDGVRSQQASMCDRHRVRVVVDVAASMPRIELDAAKVTQVLLHLTRNAIEAMAEGGGCLELRARLGDTHLVIEVHDTGPGIAEGIDVFAPFRTTKPKGTGLGLPIVRQILGAHGGTLAYESDAYKGTTFRVVLPV